MTLYFTRLVLGVQLVLAGVQLPSKYLQHEWKSLALLLGPGMTGMWICSSLLVWAMVPDLSFLHSLAIGACVTPTDPVLSNSIVKGKFADKNIPKDLQKIIIAESGANDGLGYPFLFLALYLIKYVGSGGAGQPGGARLAMAYWFGETWGYTIILSVLYGATVGYIAKELLHWAEEKRFVDRESFLVFAITLALFITGTCGMIGSDDVLACFITGNAFTHDDWFRLKTKDDSLQPTIDMLLNLSIFIWFGAVCPWASFAHNDVIPIYRLIFLGILILLFRRLPVVFALHWKIWQIEEKQQALFVGFFGPIGVSAVFYLYVSLQFLGAITVDGAVREDAARLEDQFTVVIWFLAVCSIVCGPNISSKPGSPLWRLPTTQVVHGLSVPLGKLGYKLPRTFSSAMGSRSVSEDPEEPEAPFHIRGRISHEVNAHMQRDRNEQRARDGPPREVFRIGRRTIPSDGNTTPQALRYNENRTTSDIELTISTKKGSESAAEDVTPSSGSKHSSSKDVQKEDFVNEES